MVEGGLWLTLPAGSVWSDPLTITYLIFSNVFWPIYVPIAVLMIEPSAQHRRRLLVPLAAGAATSGFFLYALATNPVSAVIAGSHIDYGLPHDHDMLVFGFYAAATCLAPILSSQPMIRLFGAVLVLSMIAAYGAYMNWFASVWCFFAAILSAAVYLQFRRRNLYRGELSQPGL